MAGEADVPVISDPEFFRTMHGNTSNTDNIWLAIPPVFELDWVKETDLYVPEGPTFDSLGNVYFSPLYPKENISLVSLDGNSGERRWTIPGDGRNGGSGAILILKDPLTDKDIIYHSTYTEGMAIDVDGNILWRTPTGLSFSKESEGSGHTSHSFGFNYHPDTDSLIGVTYDGNVFAFDRSSGKSRGRPFQLPGRKTPVSQERPDRWVMAIGDKETDKAFGRLPNGSSFFTTIVDIIYGGGGEVTNYFAIDPNTSSIYIAATAQDSMDGEQDGLSKYGAIYKMSLQESRGQFSFSIDKSVVFPGGTGSTPSISPDSRLLMVSDGEGHAIALDRGLNELWRVQLDDQVAASIAIAPENNEIYAVTKNDVFKIINYTNHGEIQWKAKLDAWESQVEFNALTPTVAANGILVSIGAGGMANDQQIMMDVGMALIDRKTGDIRYFSPGREESIAVSSVGPGGQIFTANSPVRRAVGHGLFPNKTKPIIGGISKYKGLRHDLLVRDATCAAYYRLENLLTWISENPTAALVELRQIRVLLNQAYGATIAYQASKKGDQSSADDWLIALSESVDNLRKDDFQGSNSLLKDMCEAFD